MALIKIKIVSDVICPWCYIGYRSLQRAIALYQKTYPGGSQDQFEISWKPYFIDQVAPAQSELIQDRMIRRMKDPKMVEAAQTRLKRTGAEVGLNFRFGGSMGSSRKAHQLLHVVGKEHGYDVQCRLAEQLFHYQFEREEDISRIDTIIQAAVQAGLFEMNARDLLASDREMHEVEQEEGAIRAAGIHGVPHFIIGDDQHLDGAADYTEFLDAFIAVRGGVSD
ncbi:thioredoxin-like protein [Aspergillus avenaceus]|uniref:Thioredoxin-like protein n=1 Tax=Aspergillus avenaceus TaxID=36643 RepID=A0A5N6TKT9_ASPAV|nr:thioredoxin-like protein [Aspergillus avenaceus]